MLWRACLFTHTHTHTHTQAHTHCCCSGRADGNTIQGAAKDLVIYKRLYKLPFNWPSQTGSEVLGMWIPGVKMAGVEAERRDSAVGIDEAPASCSGRANEARHGIKSIAASLIFVHHLITRNGTGAKARTAGSIRHKPTVDYKPVKMCQYIYCCCWLDSNMLIIFPSNHFFVFGSKILTSVQMRGLFFL